MTDGSDANQLASPDQPGDQTRVPHLDRTIQRTRIAIGVERGLRAFWPVWTLGFAIYAALRLDALRFLPDWSGLPLLGVCALGLAVLIGRAVRDFRWPRRSEAVARLDRELPGRPIAALSDRQATGRGDVAAAAVWAAHMRRVAAQAARAKAAAADLNLAARDPYGLRFAAVSLLIAALLFGSGTVTEQLDAGLSSPARASIETGPVLEAWATPPAYTGKPTLYLTDLTEEDAIAMPQGTVLTLRLYGSDAPGLSQSIFTPPAGSVDFGEGERGFHQTELRADRTGRLTISDGSQTLASWSISVLPDMAPEVILSGPPERTVVGAGKFSYEGRDDYGIVAAWATVTLDLSRIERRFGLVVPPEPRDPISFDLPLPLSGAATDFTETEIIDLSTHPWADLPVSIVLHARDAAGQEVTSPVYDVTLPGRRFYEAHAAAIVEQRRDFLWSLDNTGRVSRLLKAITHAPEEVFASPKAYLMTRTAIRRLDYARQDDRVAEVRADVADLLWLAALLIEEGDIASALERLRRAQERLADALREDASEEELAELMQELRQAMQEYMQELMRQALEDMEQQDQDQAQTEPNMSTQDLQEMLERIEELMRQGRREEAEELLRQLQQMMENLQMTMRPGQPQDGQGQQMMEGLQNLMRQQQELGDETFEELQRQLGEGQPQPGQPGQQPGTDQLGQQQEALRQLLDEFRQGMPRSPSLPGQEDDPMGDARRALEEAERNMGDARDRLGDGDPGRAVDDQAEALENLREGMRNLAEAQRMAQQQTGPQNGTQANDNPGQQRDPLGRPIGETGQIDGSDVEIPGSEAYKRSRELREEILRRSGEQERPRLELDYLRRLLERF
ncbi:MAG: TIGR02302 family protein [Pseudomonadota bacterium]